jgi:hypothetical protein
MMIRHPQGQCVSCGRRPPWPHVIACPFCNEEILMPRAWVFLRRVWIALFTLSLGLVVVLPVMCMEDDVASQPGGAWPVLRWILFSIAAMLILAPHDPQDVIVSSQKELRVWQLKTLFGSMVMGTGALILGIRSVYGLLEWPVAISCGVLLVCLLISPWFFRLSAWRIWVGTALVFTACFCR